MEIKKDVIIFCKSGQYEVKMGNGLTSIYFKDQEKMVFHTKELDELILMLQSSREELKKVC